MPPHFYKDDVAELRRLIGEKEKATPSQQKWIRQQMRNMGFRISYFTTSRKGFTVKDFDTLIATGQILVSSSNRSDF